MYNRSGIWASLPRNGEFQSVLSQTDVFRQNRRLTPLDFEPKFKFLKTHNKLYKRPFYTTDLEYGVTDKKYGVSISFSQTDVFQ
jgi:hypothetical protein